MSGVFEKPGIKLNRTAKLAKILTQFGFEELKIKSGEFSLPNDSEGKVQFFSRVRRVLEELGPTYVKFGQTLSTREDLFPSELISEFKKLQDNVPFENFDVFQRFEEELGLTVEEVFDSLEKEPFASASIAQVYKGYLKNGNPVILKVKRPGIKKIIQADLLLLKDLVSILHNYYATVREINLLHVFEAFENNLYQELSFNNELKNIQQFALNFKSYPKSYNMQAISDFSNDGILCLTFIEGKKINDKNFLQEQNISQESVFDTLLELYLAQILEFGFFHADPHPGNILVNSSGHITFIDLGSMGKMYTKDKEFLEDFVIYFINKDAERLVSTIKKMAISTAIEIEKNLERDLVELFDIISSNTLENIDIKAMFSRFSRTLNQNRIVMPEHVYLLVKGIVLIEGIGRELVPNLNIIEKIKPYVKIIVSKRLQPQNLMETHLTSLWELQRMLGNTPKTLGKVFEQIQNQEIKIKTENAALDRIFKEYKKHQNASPFLWIALSFLGFGIFLNVGNQIIGFTGFDWASWALITLSVFAFILYFLKYFKINS